MSNPASFTFRTALGGFHRGDVSEYISKTAQEHQSAVAELERKIQALTEENDLLRTQLSQAQEDCAELQDKLSPEPEPSAPAETLEARELNAYRRAEAAERLANQRVRKVYSDVQEICGSALAQLDDSDSAAQAAANSIQIQLEIIRSSLEAVYASLRDSTAKLKAASQMVPDPAEGLEEE